MKKALIGLLFVLSTLLTACTPSGNSVGSQTGPTVSPPPETAAYHKITAEEAKRMMDDGNVTVVDVRRADEYAAGHIAGSILIPNEEIADEPPAALPDLDAVLLVHCRTGVRSKQASDKLVELGYQNVYDFGGMIDWPYDVVTESDSSAPAS